MSKLSEAIKGGHPSLLGNNRDSGETHVDALLPRLPHNPLASLIVVLEPEDLGVINRQVLIRVPRRGSERLESSVTLEPDRGWDMFRRVDFVRESEVVSVI